MAACFPNPSSAGIEKQRRAFSCDLEHLSWPAKSIAKDVEREGSLQQRTGSGAQVLMARLIFFTKAPLRRWPRSAVIHRPSFVPSTITRWTIHRMSASSGVCAKLLHTCHDVTDHTFGRDILKSNEEPTTILPRANGRRICSRGLVGAVGARSATQNTPDIDTWLVYRQNTLPSNCTAPTCTKARRTTCAPYSVYIVYPRYDLKNGKTEPSL
jgi:hypothetical protein